MRRFDKRKNIMEANLRLEREFITSKNILLNTTRSSTFIEACLNSQYFDEDEKSFIIESVLPNQKLIQEGGWDWLKNNIVEPTKNAVTKGVDKAKSFYNKVKTLISNIGEILKSVWSHIVKWTEWAWDKIIEISKNIVNKSKDKITKHLEEFQNLPPDERDTEIEQLNQTMKFYSKGANSILDVFSSEVGKAIVSVQSGSDSVLDESWSPEVIDFFSGEKKFLNEDEGKGGKWTKKVGKFLLNAFEWIIKIPVKFFEEAVIWLTKRGMKSFSKFTKRVGGPGIFEFKHISKIFGSILFTLAELATATAVTFGGHLPKGFPITDVISGWEHIVTEFMEWLIGHWGKPVAIIISWIGVIYGVLHIYHNWHEIKKPQIKEPESPSTNTGVTAGG